MMRWLVVGLCVLMAGCLVPDRYTATLSLTGAGDYTLNYDGEAVDLVMLDAREKGQLTPKLERDMVALYTKELAKQAKGLTLTYKGDARFRAKFDSAGNYRSGKVKEIADLLQLRLMKDGILDVKSVDLGNVKKLPKGVSSTGDICITTDMEVIEHNADSTPGLLSKCYRWKNYDMINGPRLVLRLKAKG